MQSAMNALNPVKSIGAQFKDAMQANGKCPAEQSTARSAEVLRMVGIDPAVVDGCLASGTELAWGQVMTVLPTAPSLDGVRPV